MTKNMPETVVDPAGIDYIKRERCPYCVKRSGSPETCNRRITETLEAWRCWGYRSRLCDERMTFSK